MDHLGLHSVVQVGESGGVPYAAACAALLPRRTQALLLLAGLAAVHGRENAVQLKSLSTMDRFSMNWAARLGGARLISHFVKLAADVSATVLCLFDSMHMCSCLRPSRHVLACPAQRCGALQCMAEGSA